MPKLFGGSYRCDKIAPPEARIEKGRPTNLFLDNHSTDDFVIESQRSQSGLCNEDTTLPAHIFPPKFNLSRSALPFNPDTLQTSTKYC